MYKRKLVFIEGEENKDGGVIEIVGGVSGSGKTRYALKQAAEAIVRGESVLFSSDEVSPSQIKERLLSEIAPEEYTNYKNGGESEELIYAINLLANADLNIQYNYSSFNEKSFINEIKSSEPDLVVIDALKLGSKITRDNEDITEQLLEGVSKFNEGIKSRVIIATQLNINFMKSV